MEFESVVPGGIDLRCWAKSLICLTKLGHYVSFDITNNMVGISASLIRAVTYNSWLQQQLTRRDLCLA
jgi:hypothetical protein